MSNVNMIDFLMLLGTFGWIYIGLFAWLLIRLTVALNCSEEVNDHMFIFDIAFLCFVFAIVYFNDDVQFLLW